MKKIILLSVIISGLFLTACSQILNDDESEGSKSLSRDLTASEAQIVESSSSFSYAIFRKTVQPDTDENLFISPLSISMALGMTLNGAANETREGMKEALHLQGMEIENINKSYSSLIKLLITADPKVKMKLANSIWMRDGFSTKAKFTETCKKFFNARIESLDFSDPSAANKINQWVSDNTEGLIDKIIDGRIPNDVVMYLINAIYFKGDWQYQFDPKLTSTKEFALEDGSTTQVEMMSQKNDLAAYISDEVQLLDLPYGDSLFTMTLMMPGDDKTSLDEFIQNDLTAANVNKWISGMKVEPTNIELPKFELAYKITMNDVLESMGMEQAFSAKAADFSNINGKGGLFISEVKHKAFVRVDEEGTEAAAVTSVAMGITSVPKIRTIKFNRPFVFIIRERTSDTILFMGKMGNPSKS